MPLKGNTVSFIGMTSSTLTSGIAARAKARRLQLGWSREELAARSGVSPWTLKRFEVSGRIALETLAKLAVVLEEVPGFERLFSPKEAVPQTMRQLERLNPPVRKRGRTLR